MPDITDALNARAANTTNLSRAFENANQNEWPLAAAHLDRAVILNGALDDEKAAAICARMWSMSLEKPGQDILFYINSPGGSVTAGMAIYDMMRRINCDVRTIGSGQCASMGSFLLAAGTKGKRAIMPNTQVMMHQPSAGTRGMVTDMELDMAEFARLKNRMIGLYAHFLDISREDCVRLLERNTYINALTARELGHVDQIVVKAPGENREYSADDKKLFQVEMDIQREEMAKQAPFVAEIIASRNANRPPAAANDDSAAPSSGPSLPRLVVG